MKKRGILISIIGLDGSGKTTQAGLLCKWLKEQGIITYDVHSIPCYADWVFDTIAYKKGKDTMDLFSPTVVDFAVAIDKVRDFSIYTEKLSNHNTIVVSQRYTYCKIASAIQNDVQYIDLLSEIYSWVPKPDLTFYMDLPVEIAVERVLERGVDEESYSSLDNFKKSYESLPEYKDFIKIAANRSVEEVQETLRSYVRDYLQSINFNSSLST